MKILGYVFIIVIIFFIGFILGRQPTVQEKANAVNTQAVIFDLHTIAGQTTTLFNLCEQKYQLAFNGNWSEAVRINGQMDALRANVEAIKDKYRSFGL